MADGLKKLFSQFTVQAIVQSPCDSGYNALLNQTVILKRPHDTDEAVKKVNEYGEIVLTYPTAPVIETALKVRIDPIKQGSESGYVVKTQGGEVYATFKVFVCPDIDIRENDIITLGTREYQVLLVDDLFSRSTLHHRECLCRRTDNL